VLKDIHLPPANWWPPAPGWWLLAVLLLLVVGALAWWLWRSVRGTTLRAALREVDALQAAHARDGNAALLADGASQLMRRVALRVAPGAAAQTGAAWRAFVFAHAPDEGTGRALDALSGERFRPQPKLDAQALLAALRAWCRNALRPRRPTPFHGKGVAPQVRGDDAREAHAMPGDRPAPPSGQRAFSGTGEVAPQARSDQVHPAPRNRAP
jgi:hypothetical protein